MPSFKQKVNNLQCIISVIIKSTEQDVKGFSLSDLEKEGVREIENEFDFPRENAKQAL